MLILIRAILEQSINNKMVSKILVEMSTTVICIYTNAKFIVICKPGTLNDGDEDSVQYKVKANKTVPTDQQGHFGWIKKGFKRYVQTMGNKLKTV